MDIHDAARAGDADEIPCIIDDMCQDVNAKDAMGMTPLHWAIQEGHLRTVSVLLDNGAEVNLGHSEGWTPLHHAVGYGYAEIVKLLLEHGADVEAPSRKGTPLQIAAYNGDPEVIKYLLDFGADFITKDPIGLTPLAVTISEGRDEAAELLRRQGAKM